MKTLNLEGIQLHTYDASYNSPRTNQIYAEYANSLHDILSDYQPELERLKTELNSLPVWLKESQVCTCCIIQELDVKNLARRANHLLARPQQLIDSLELAESLSLSITQNCCTSETDTRDLWLKIVESIAQIPRSDTPIVVWHLEQNYLTIFTTSLKQIYAASRTN